MNKLALFISSVLVLNSCVLFADHIDKTLPSEVKFGPHPALPKEIQVAVIKGDPQSDGTLVLRIKAPAGSSIAPHWHSVDENVTVISGSINLGNGDKFDKTAGTKLPQGSFASIPAKHHHYAWFTEDTVVQLNNFGLFDLFYVNPSDDPQKK